MMGCRILQASSCQQKKNINNPMTAADMLSL
jgi:hypothetical protein